MEDLSLIFKQFVVWFAQLFETCRSSWLLTIAIFLMVLDLIVSILLIIRGGHD